VLIPGVKSIFVGLTNFCNYNCKMCPQYLKKTFGSGKGFMSKNILIKFLDSLKELSIKTDCVPQILLIFLGESTLHPEFALFFKKMSQIKYIKGITLFTNGTGFSLDMQNELIEAILNSDLKFEFVFSIDAFKESTYRKIRSAGRFKKAVRTAEWFLLKKKEKRLKNLKLSFQFLILPENYNEAIEFRNLWQEKIKGAGFEPAVAIGCLSEEYQKSECCITYRQATLSNFSESKKVFEIVNNKLGMKAEFKGFGIQKDIKKKRSLCKAMFECLTLNWDGRLTVCCYDNDLEINLGDLHNQTLFSIWTGEKLRGMRQAALTGDMESLPEICRLCLNFETDTDEISESRLRRLI